MTLTEPTLWDRTDAIAARDDAVRFWSRVDRGEPDECWEWQGWRQAKGYGNTTWLGTRTTSHRVAYELAVGPIPDGLHIDHLCRNRACCNPVHLEPVTPRENNLRGYGAAGNNARKERCCHGHPFAGHNLRVVTRRSGLRVRVCRECAAEAMRAIRARRAAG